MLDCYDDDDEGIDGDDDNDNDGKRQDYVYGKGEYKSMPMKPIRK